MSIVQNIEHEKLNTKCKLINNQNKLQIRPLAPASLGLSVFAYSCTGRYMTRTDAATDRTAR